MSQKNQQEFNRNIGGNRLCHLFGLPKLVFINIHFFVPGVDWVIWVIWSALSYNSNFIVSPKLTSITIPPTCSQLFVQTIKECICRFCSLLTFVFQSFCSQFYFSSVSIFCLGLGVGHLSLQTLRQSSCEFKTVCKFIIILTSHAVFLHTAYYNHNTRTIFFLFFFCWLCHVLHNNFAIKGSYKASCYLILLGWFVMSYDY